MGNGCNAGFGGSELRPQFRTFYFLRDFIRVLSVREAFSQNPDHHD